MCNYVVLEGFQNFENGVHFTSMNLIRLSKFFFCREASVLFTLKDKMYVEGQHVYPRDWKIVMLDTLSFGCN